MVLIYVGECSEKVVRLRECQEEVVKAYISMGMSNIRVSLGGIFGSTIIQDPIIYEDQLINNKQDTEWIDAIRSSDVWNESLCVRNYNHCLAILTTEKRMGKPNTMCKRVCMSCHGGDPKERRNNECDLYSV